MMMTMTLSLYCHTRCFQPTFMSGLPAGDTDTTWTPSHTSVGPGVGRTPRVMLGAFYRDEVDSVEGERGRGELISAKIMGQPPWCDSANIYKALRTEWVATPTFNSPEHYAECCVLAGNASGMIE